MTDHLKNASNHYRQIAKAIEYIAEYRGKQPSLAEIASHVELSEFHLQRLFSKWAGISPKQYLQYLTKEYALQRLKEESVLDAALSSGLSGASRLHELIINWQAMTPGEYKQNGRGLKISYGFQDSPFGQCLLASTHRGICKLAFFDNRDELAQLEAELYKDWSGATITRDPNIAKPYAEQIFANGPTTAVPLRLLLRGSKFQQKVWEALLAIPQGGICSYQQVAEMIGAPSSVRAVASAIAKNNIGYLIPCHRVIRATGEFSNYRWGKTRKKAMLCREAGKN